MQILETIILVLLGSAAYRVRGGMFNSTIRKLLKKPEGWEIDNGIIRGIWALFITLLLPMNLSSLLVFALAFIGVTPGYFGGKFDLSLKENRVWKNYAWLSARGAFIILPLALCFTQLYPQLWYGVAAGVLLPICYLIGFAIPEIKGKISHSQWGEFLIGAIITWSIL